MNQPEDRQLEIFRDEMRQLVYVFSHDMRNPLVNMQALLNEMRDSLQAVRDGESKLLEQGMPETLDMFEQSVTQMNEMIRGANDIYHC
ncbi:MAG: histidine kinase dimerization/phospho-acceptor domain-containing protein, partial [Mariprofundaceae bacterium]